MRSDHPLIVSLTTTPSRLQSAGPTLQSLAEQSRPADRVLLVLPMTCDREPEPYHVPSWMSNYPFVSVVRCEKDYGPGTKLLGALPHIHGPSCLIVVDDDNQYAPYLFETLYERQCEQLDASFSFFTYSWGPLKSIGQGADGFSFYTPNLYGISDFAEKILESRHLRVHDDLWISAYLQLRGVETINVRPLSPRPDRPPYEVAHSDNQLSQVSGSLSRDSVTREGVAYLISKGYFGFGKRSEYYLRALARRLMRR